MDLSDFATRQPVLEPEHFFAGDLQGWGLEVGPLGGIGRRLQVTATGRFDEATQTFAISTRPTGLTTAHVDRLEWQIHKLAAHSFTRRGKPGWPSRAGQGRGSAFRLAYRRNMPQTDGLPRR